MNDFYHSVIQVEYPEVELKFKDDSVLQKVLQFVNPDHKHTTSCSKNSIWFSSRKFFNGASNETINEILAHEYVHLIQRKKNPFHNLLGSLPESIGATLVVTAIVTVTYGLGMLFWLCGLLGILLMLPIAPLYRLEREFEAYRMSVLVRIAQWNGKFKLPKSHYDLFQMSDDMIRDMMNGLFSKTYAAQWAPTKLKVYYFERMRKWRDNCMLKYFVERLAFEKGNTYIESTSDIYIRTLRYFIKASARQ